MSQTFDQIAEVLGILRELAKHDLQRAQAEVRAAARERQDLVLQDRSANLGTLPADALKCWDSWRSLRIETLGRQHLEALARRSAALDSYARATGRFEAARKLATKSR